MNTSPAPVPGGADQRPIRTDVNAQCSAMYRQVVGVSGPDMDVTGLIARHGLDQVADVLTGMVEHGLHAVAHRRGGYRPPEAILEEYFARLFSPAPAELTELVRRQLADGRLPAEVSPTTQEDFLLGLFVLHAASSIELAGSFPRDDLAATTPGLWPPTPSRSRAAPRPPGTGHAARRTPHTRSRPRKRKR